MQRRSTKIIQHLQEIPYVERLHYLKLPTLEYRRLREDLIFVYKITYDLIDSKFEMQCNICGNIPMLQPSLDQRTGGHPYKYQIHHHPGVRNNFITARVLNTWNGLNTSTVLSNSLNIFKNNLQKDSSMPDPYDYCFHIEFLLFTIYYFILAGRGIPFTMNQLFQAIVLAIGYPY